MWSVVSNVKRFKNILCVVETGEAVMPALERAVVLAENNQASLTVVHVIDRIWTGLETPDDDLITGDLQTTMASVNENQLEAIVEPYRKRIDLQTAVLQGVPFLEIIREVLRNKRDLVIKIPQPLDWLDRLFGSDDMHLLRKCPCPVWLIKPEVPKSYRRILAAVDVDDSYAKDELVRRNTMNRHILEMASSLALSEFAELHIVHVWDAIGENAMRSAFGRATDEQITAYVEHARRRHEQNLDALIREVIGNTGQDAMNYFKPKKHLVKGWARKDIPVLAKQIDVDLIVMGTVARTGVPGFIMGNTAETILNQIDCSVLAIKPPGFVTPVTLEE